MKIVITGGHHTGTLPVIKELQKRQNVELFWFGRKYAFRKDKNTSLEYREVTSLGIPFYNLHAGKLYKTFNLFRLLKIPFGVLQAFFLLHKIRPDVILSFGGYIAAPTVLAGWVLGIPSVTHEQTVVAGYANRFIAKFAKKILITWEESKKYFPSEKVVTVGLPLRSEIFEVKTNNIEQSPDLPTIYITAGKTGSHIINENILASLEELLSFCNVIHQCGDASMFNDYEKLSAKYKKLNASGKYNLRKFVYEDEIGEVFNKADLVVGRSGAHTILELLAMEKPAILIPIPWVSHNEQFENAKLLYKAGLARILPEHDLSPTALPTALKVALKNLDYMKLNKPELKKSIVSNSAELIANETLSLSN